ncbi:MAG TPA: YhbY family RNA-binding protein [Burkholderiales bacterium]
MLTAAERKALKGRAHKLEPVVHIGAKGLAHEVVAEARNHAQPVQQVGKIFVIYRKNPC